ncbi:MAG: S9 family peptidase, partial [Acidobacteriaceae bacterium]
MIHEAALSPDGQMIAWAVDGDMGIEIQMAAMDDPGHPRRLTAGTGQVCTEDNLAWSPDSKSLAFTSDCNASPNASEQADVYLASRASTSVSPRRLTHLHGGVTTLEFSPDGLHIACLYIQGATRPAGALAAMKPPSGVIGVEGLEIQRVASIETASGQFRQITPETLHVYEYGWAPDSRQLAYIAAAPPGENNWWVAQLYTQAISGGQPQSILDPEHTPGQLHGLQIAVPRWSPDGQKIAFIGGLMSDQGVTGGDIYLVPATGGTAKSLTAWTLGPHPPPGTGFTSSWIHWTSAGTLIVSGIHGGSTSVLRIAFKPSDRPGASQSARPFESEGGQLFEASTIRANVLEGSLSLSTDNRKIAFVESSFEQAPEVWAGTLAPPEAPERAGEDQFIQAITHINDQLKPAWGKSRTIDWHNDEFNIQGWLLYP